MHRKIAALLVIGLMVWPALGQTQHSITLNWLASPTTGVNYNVYRGTVTGGPYSKITATPVTALTYVDTTGTGGTTYFYVVTAVCTASCPAGVSGESGFSNEGSGTFLSSPQLPSQLKVVAQ